MAAANDPEALAWRPEVFLDTSVLFAAVLSERGGSRLILKLGEAGAIQLLASRQVLKEAEGVLRRKAPEALAVFSLLLDRAGIRIIPTAASVEVEKWAKPVGHPGDAQIAADAQRAVVDYLVTLDRTHLLGNRRLAGSLSFPIGAPADFLAWYRARLRV